MNTYKIVYSYPVQGRRREAVELAVHETAYKAVREFRRYWNGCEGFRIERVYIERPCTWEEVGGGRMKPTFSVSFRCYYDAPGDFTTHYQKMPLKDIPKWIEAYIFTHPAVQSITVKVWPKDGGTE